MKEICELKPSDLNCNIFSCYDYDGLALQELLSQFFTRINECIEVSNKTIKLAEWLVNEGLSEEVAKKLVEWLNDGTLEKIINKKIFGDIKSALDDIYRPIDKQFAKGTSFFAQNDEHIDKYLLTQPSRVENYKKCGLTHILIAFSCKYESGVFSPYVSYSKLKEAVEYLQGEGFKVGLKFQDGGGNTIRPEQAPEWFTGKKNYLLCHTKNMKDLYMITIANEIPNLTNTTKFRKEWQDLYDVVKKANPTALLAVNTFSSDFYFGRICIADIVDALGINYYPYVGDMKVATVDEVKKAIYKPKNSVYTFDALNYFSKRYNKPWFVSEWGTSSFEYQTKNPSTDFLPDDQKVINPEVQANFMAAAAEEFPFITGCTGVFYWSSNCWRKNDTALERSWAWDESQQTIDAVAKVWGNE